MSKGPKLNHDYMSKMNKCNTALTAHSSTSLNVTLLIYYLQNSDLPLKLEQQTQSGGKCCSGGVTVYVDFFLFISCNRTMNCCNLCMQKENTSVIFAHLTNHHLTSGPLGFYQSLIVLITFNYRFCPI